MSTNHTTPGAFEHAEGQETITSTSIVSQPPWPSSIAFAAEKLGGFIGRREARDWQPGEEHREHWHVWFPAFRYQVYTQGAGLTLAELARNYCECTSRYEERPAIVSDDGEAVTLKTADFAALLDEVRRLRRLADDRNE